MLVNFFLHRGHCFLKLDHFSKHFLQNKCMQISGFEGILMAFKQIGQQYFRILI